VNAVRYGIPNLTRFIGNRDGLADNEGGEIAAEGLALLVPWPNEKGIMLILELLNSKVDHPDYQVAGNAATVGSTGSRTTARIRRALSRPRSPREHKDEVPLRFARQPRWLAGLKTLQ
jgi:hypothetical protein